MNPGRRLFAALARWRITTVYLCLMVTLTFLAVIFQWRV